MNVYFKFNFKFWVLFKLSFFLFIDLAISCQELNWSDHPFLLSWETCLRKKLCPPKRRLYQAVKRRWKYLRIILWQAIAWYHLFQTTLNLQCLEWAASGALNASFGRWKVCFLPALVIQVVLQKTHFTEKSAVGWLVTMKSYRSFSDQKKLLTWIFSRWVLFYIIFLSAWQNEAHWNKLKHTEFPNSFT